MRHPPLGLIEIIEKLSLPAILPAAEGRSATGDSSGELTLSVEIWRNEQLAIIEHASTAIREHDCGSGELDYASDELTKLVGDIVRMADDVELEAKRDFEKVADNVANTRPDAADRAVQRQRLMAARFKISAVSKTFRSVAEELGKLVIKIDRTRKSF